MLVVRTLRRARGTCTGAGLRGARGLASADPRILILSPREARLVPKRHAPHTPAPQPSISFTPEVPVPPKNSAAAVADAIEQQRPSARALTTQALAAVSRRLSAAFKKENLSAYVASRQERPPGFHKLRKDKMVKYILETVWGCHASSEPVRGVDNVLELSERDFVLVLGQGGALLREFSKSGAELSLRPAHTQVLVHSSPQTFQWIQARLAKFIETVWSSEVQFEHIGEYVSQQRAAAELRAVQQITDSYFEWEGRVLTIFTAGRARKANATFAKRLLFALVERQLAQRWLPSTYYTDELSANNDCFLHPFDDAAGLEWYDKLYTWTRLERIKEKEPYMPRADAILREVKAPEFCADEPQAPKPLSSQLENIIARMRCCLPAPSLNGQPVSQTLTCTFGYVLHRTQGELLPSAGMPRIFETSVPYIARLASTLPFYADDVGYDTTAENLASTAGEVAYIQDSGAIEPLPIKSPMEAFQADSSHTAENQNLIDRRHVQTMANDGTGQLQSASDELSAIIENLDSAASRTSGEQIGDLWSSWEQKVHATRRKEEEFTEHTRLLHARFIASPELGLAAQYPPIDAWVPLQDGGEVKLLAVPREQSSCVSLPDRPADLKLSVSDSYPVPNTPETTAFFDRCREHKFRYGLDRVLLVTFGDKEVPYVCSRSDTVTVSELDWRSRPLQLSRIDNRFEKRVDATLVGKDGSALVADALEFVEALLGQRPRVD